jgi:hypothetical protein
VSSIRKIEARLDPIDISLNSGDCSLLPQDVAADSNLTLLKIAQYLFESSLPLVKAP